MRHLLFVSLLAVTGVALNQPAQAQGLFKRLAERAIQKAEQKADEAVDAVLQGSQGAEPETGQAEIEQAPPAPMIPPRAGKSAEPQRSKAARFVDDIPVPADIEKSKAEYDRFGQADCHDCEGGVQLDGRPTFSHDQFSGQYNERAARAGNWPVGYVHRWQGHAANGALTVKSEERMEAFRCRRLEYRLTKGSTSVSRPGLICFGLANSSSEVEKWHEVY